MCSGVPARESPFARNLSIINIVVRSRLPAEWGGGGGDTHEQSVGTKQLKRKERSSSALVSRSLVAL